MELQPLLQGELITLRPFKAHDFSSLYKAASDPLIWEQHPKTNRYLRSSFEEYFQEAIDSKGSHMVIDHSTEKIIGCSRFYNLDLIKSEVTIGATFLTRPYWGGIYNRELKHLMIDHAFHFVETIEFHVGEHNYRSQKALEKLSIPLSHCLDISLQEGISRKILIYKIHRTKYSQ